ncbi:sulfatase-like hydrolase/transferase [Lutibacter citreus]|uniref:sulfatase-like hydrolase/transferase n=1 Tax=Lutibacter citreus TaxID=2138210 RepID=UPI000DBE21A9|nr:sulfatase-like hydrolase/transferase [Lutibacter citreus]
MGRIKLILVVFVTVFTMQKTLVAQNKAEKKPNILWITTEDISPHFGCYDDEYAYTPTIDKMAKEGVLYSNAYASASVCTPARSSIITGKYASSLGTQHLRAHTTLSKDVKCFSEDLRESGYYCLNFNKKDYNFSAPEAWDYDGFAPYDSLVVNNLANLPKDKPFFCVFNMFLTHQSQTRYDKFQLHTINSLLPPEARHTPDNVPVPSYYPNTPKVRENLAALHTQITIMDMWMNEILKQLEESGLAENTIVFFYSDHGDGLPRHKRWLYDSGTKVPFIIKFPKKYQYLSGVKPGEEKSDLINFVDLAPTMLSITGCEIPENLPGKVFLGAEREKRDYTFSIKDRIGENIDFSRSVSDGRYQYNRNFMHNKARMPWCEYSEPTPIRIELRKLDRADKLNEQTGWLMQKSKPIEEFYDIQNDPYQMKNLVNDPQYHKKMEEMKSILFDWMIANRDLSLIPEPYMRGVSRDLSPLDAFADNNVFPIKKILSIADKNVRGEAHLKALIAGLSDASPIVRYWAVMGISSLENNNQSTLALLKGLLKDDDSIVRLAASESLVKIEKSRDAIQVLGELLIHENIVTRFYAARVLIEYRCNLDDIKGKINDSRDIEPAFIPTRVYRTSLDEALQKLEIRL